MSPTQAPTSNLLILTTGGTSSRQTQGPSVAGIAGAVAGVMAVAAVVTTLLLRWSNPRNSSRIAPDPNAGAPEFQVNSDGLLELRPSSLAHEDAALVPASPADQPESSALLGSGPSTPSPLNPHRPVLSPASREDPGSSGRTDALSPRRRVVRLRPLQEDTGLEEPQQDLGLAEQTGSLEGPAVGRWVGPGEVVPPSQAPPDTARPPPEEEEQLDLPEEAEENAGEAADAAAAPSDPVSEPGPAPSSIEERPAEAVTSSAADSAVPSEARWLPVISLSSLADLPPIFCLSRQPAAEGGGQPPEKRADGGGGESTVKLTPEDEELLEVRKADLLERKKKKKKTKTAKPGPPAAQNVISPGEEAVVQYDDRPYRGEPEVKPSGYSFSRRPRFEAPSPPLSTALGPRPDYLRPARSVATTPQNPRSPTGERGGGVDEARIKEGNDEDVYDF
jgi:hypothetical protein